ncbi:DUF58 domain-containing protein [bacterium]|nr:MAG: DUF58 domain-containing protein [bacterium]
MISKEIFKKVRLLEVRTKGLVNNLFGGEYHSAFKGRGMVFSEVRAYQYGDDIRQIDWNVTARSGEPFIKIFEEEREQTLMLVVDISPSKWFGSQNQSKRDVTIEMCAVLAFSAIQNGDKVGLLLFSDTVEKMVIPKKGKQHVLRLIRELYHVQPTGKGTNIDEALNYVNKVLTRRSIVILATDLMAEQYQKSIKITNKKHDLVTILVHDRLERELPDVGLMPFQDFETGQIKWVDTSSSKVRETFKRQQIEQWQEIQTELTKLKVDSVTVFTNESYVEPLMNFFKRRISRF